MSSEQPAQTTEERRARIMAAWPDIASFIATLPDPEKVTEPCSRCGGSGHFSYNMMHGSMCFKCLGNGRQIIAKQARKYHNLFKPNLKLEEIRTAGDIFSLTLPYLALQVVWATQGGARVRVRAMNLISWRGIKKYVQINVIQKIPALPGYTSGHMYGTLPDQLPQDWLGQAVQPEHLTELLEAATFHSSQAVAEPPSLVWSMEQ